MAFNLRRRIITLSQRGGYVRDTFNNTVGLFVSAALPLLIIPIISRLYTPQDFGEFGVFTAFVGMAAIAATGRYEAAIVLPEDPVGALETAVVATLFSVAVAVILIVGIGVAWLAGAPVARGNVWLMLAGVPAMFSAGLVQILLNCAIREKMFRAMSISRIVGAAMTAGLTIGLGLIKLAAWGLVIGVVGGYAATIAVLLVALSRLYLHEMVGISWRGLRSHAWRYRNFPIFSLPSDFANTVASNLPVLFFSTFFGTAATGYLTMFQRIWAGTAIFVRGLGETFRQRAAENQKVAGNFSRIYRLTFSVLAAISVIMLIALVALGPFVFATVVGSQWREAGIYGQILAPLVCMQFIASPLSWSFYIAERLRTLMLWQWSLLFIFVAVLWTGTHLMDAHGTLSLLALAGSIMYAIYLFASYVVAKGKGARQLGSAV